MLRLCAASTSRHLSSRSQALWPETSQIVAEAAPDPYPPAFSWTPDVSELGGTQRRSEAALHGAAALKGKVKLPEEVCEVVQRHIAEADKQRLRHDALALFSHLRSTSADGKQRSASNDPRPKNSLPPYNTAVSLAYASALMPSHYAATLHVLAEAAKRLKEWRPAQLLDFGSGVSAVAWAAQSVWSDSLKSYVGYDQAKPMQWLAASLLKDLKPELDTKLKLGDILAPSFQTPPPDRPTIAIAAFTLTEISHPQKRTQFIEKLYASGAEVVIVVDRGTPSGFKTVADARAQLLSLSRANQQPGHVLAPCPHDKPCPLRYSTDFCHFAQRLERPDFLMKTKHSGRGDEDASFSYVIFSRAPRPTSNAHLSQVASATKSGPLTSTSKPQELVLSDQSNDTAYFDLHQYGASPTVAATPPEASEASSAMQQESAHWPRLVAPPLKRSGHVLLDGCAASGKIERMVIPKSQGKQVYSDARKARWGDLFPHSSKHATQERSRGVRRLRPMPTENIDLADVSDE